MIITKDDREIELMTEAGRIVALVHEKLKEVIVPGITTNEIDQICDKIIREQRDLRERLFQSHDQYNHEE